MQNPRNPLALWPLLALLALLPAHAQEPEEAAVDPEDLFAEVVDVNVVNVEVYVTDKDGNRVKGLTQDDFELEVDRQAVAITNFYAVEGGKAVTETVEPIVSEDEPLDPRRREELLVPEDQRLHMVVYVDNFNLHPFTRNRVLSNLRTFLRTRLDRGDKVMLVTYDRSLHVRHPFTSDPELIASALFEIEELSGHAVHFDSERRDILRDIEEAENVYQVRGRASQYAESIYSDMRFTLDALQDLVETLAGLPGRKAILHVSDGLSMRAGEDIFYALNDRFPEESSVLLDSQRYDLTRRFQALTSQANANRVTFYTMEAIGLRTYSYMDASNATVGGGLRADQVHFSNLQGSIRFMADETGGIAMTNSNDYTPMLDRMADDFDSYYSLGFSPAATESGRYKRIKVQVKDEKKRKLKVRHRDGYRDKPVSTRMADGTLAALHYGYEKSDLPIRLEMRDQVRQENGHYLVSLLVKIPIGDLSFLPQEEMYRGRVRIYVGAKDDEGGLAPVNDIPVPIDIPSAEIESARGQYYQYEMKLIMRPGRQVVAVGIRDEIGATSGFVTRGLRVGA
jgi:VWFA-related protein